MAAEETACGYKPILAWPGMEAVRDFAFMLLEIDRQRKENPNNQFGYKQAS